MEKPKSAFEDMDRPLPSEFVFRDKAGCLYIMYNIKSLAFEKIGDSDKKSFNHILQLYYAPLDISCIKSGYSSLTIKDGMLKGDYMLIPEENWPEIKAKLESRLSSPQKPRKFVNSLASQPLQ